MDRLSVSVPFPSVDVPSIPFLDLGDGAIWFVIVVLTSASPFLPPITIGLHLPRVELANSR